MKRKIPIPLQGKIKEDEKGNQISSFHLKLKEKTDNLTDLIKYQKTSFKNSLKSCTGKWLMDIIGKKNKSLLDVGALDGKSIDLNPLSSKVKKQDFFERPMDGKVFDIVSLSLVVNFVQSPFKRGEMMVRAVKFLETNGILYITLPKSCIQNSRYLTDKTFIEICLGLGLVLMDSHFSNKIAFYAFQQRENMDLEKLSMFFKKSIVNGGAKRNNFSIVFDKNILSI